MPTIKMGAKDGVNGAGYAVTALQRHLGVAADGIFGTGTKAKLVEWQKVHGLAADDPLWYVPPWRMVYI